MFYRNATRFGVIVTIKVLAAEDFEKVLEVGTPSTMKTLGLELGIHDLLVEPGEAIQLKQGVDVQFLNARGAA